MCTCAYILETITWLSAREEYVDASYVGGNIQVDNETELSFFGYHGTDAVYLKGTVL